MSFESQGFNVVKCFPDSFKKIWASTTEIETEYNTGLEIGTPEGFCIILFSSRLAYHQAIAKDAKLIPLTAIENPDDSVSVLFKWGGSVDHQNLSLPTLDGRLITRNYLVPAPPSMIGTSQTKFIVQADPYLNDYVPTLADAKPLRVRPSNMQAIPLSGMMSYAPPEPSHYMEGGLLDTGGRLIIAGEPKVGKSRLALYMAFCLATGHPFLTFETHEYPRVLFLQFEVSEFRFQERVISVAKSMGIPADNDLPFWMHTMPSLRLDTGGGISELRKVINSFKAEICFLDPMVKLHSGDESNQQEMQLLLNNVDDLIDETGCAFIIIHHLKKPQGGQGSQSETAWERMRGSSYIPAWVDTGLVIGKRSKDAYPAVTGFLRNGENFSRFIKFNDDHTVSTIGDISSTLEQAITTETWGNPSWTKKQILEKVAKDYNMSVPQIQTTYTKMEASGQKLPA